MQRSGDLSEIFPGEAPAPDRTAEHRSDDRWLARAWESPGARVLVVGGNRLRAGSAGLDWTTPDRAPEGTRVLLGVQDDSISFAVLADRSLATDDSWQPLRGLLLALPAAEARYAVHAVGLAEWHRAMRHCPHCGGTLQPRQSGHVLACADCGREQFPRTDPAVIMLITDSEDRALLGRQPVWPAGRWSTLAGFVEPGESLEDAVRREVLEESGIPVGEVGYVGSQPWPFPRSLMLGFTGHALAEEIHVDGDELEQARWFSRDDLRRAAEDGTLVIPSGVSISRHLIERWYGAELPGAW